MLSVQVSRWSRAAAQVVYHQQGMLGRVHSAYARIVNVCTPTGRVLTLQGEGRLQAPLALALRADMEMLGARLPVGAVVVQAMPAAWGNAAALCLCCTDALVWDGRLSTHPGLRRPALAHIATALPAWLCRYTPARGLAPLLPALAGVPVHLSAACAAVHAVLTPLWEGRPPLTLSTLHALVRDLLGLGEGLTPSGDDFLVGLLALLHVTGRGPCLGDPAVREQFEPCVRQGTSLLSGEFVRCALAGHFAEPVVGLMRTLCSPGSGTWEALAAALASVGHSSGIDAMVGIAFGARLLVDG